MEYLPAAYRERSVLELDISALHSTPDLETPAAFRRCVLTGGKYSAKEVVMDLAGLASPLVIPGDREMTFGTERITAAEYAARVLSKGDLVDFIVDPEIGLRPSYVWIHIDYEDEPPADLMYSQKDDGLFALRARADEKAERQVAGTLTALEPPHALDTSHIAPGPFVIRYAGKKKRRPDLRCKRCETKFESKKRNRDSRYRVSHSPSRPFADENAASDWHCFVFHDGSQHLVSNHQILDLFGRGQYTPGHDQYDSWADLAGVSDKLPPACPS